MAAPDYVPTRASQRQCGVVLIEALVSILVLSLGILGLIGLQGSLASATAEAKYRADAALLADQIISMMWADTRSNLSTYAHKETGSNCNFSGSASANATVTKWIGSSEDAGTLLAALPGTNGAQQIVVGRNNQVTVTLCWRAPHDSKTHMHTTVAQINGGL
jgi:type IV pilus assembly protein PilV